MKPRISHRTMINALCRWFEREARDLPWRRKRMRTGYAALVAETMLQQTQVSRVVEYFPRFMRAFPNAAVLARASEHDVLAHWQGLGYYRRARHLHQAAKAIVCDFNGRVPVSVENLMTLPGVGRYTAGAIASIIHGRAEPIVDGNVERVLLRVSGRRSPRRTRDFAWQKAETLVTQADRPGVLNEALMELGATVCLPNPATPRCGECPVARWCEARKAGLERRIPAPRSRPRPKTVHHAAVVVTLARSNKIMLQQRPHGGMWGSMWQAPTFESDRPARPAMIIEAIGGNGMTKLYKCGRFSHRTTHRLIHFHVYRCIMRRKRGNWHDAGSLQALAMSTAQRRAIAMGLESEKQFAAMRSKRRVSA